MLPLYDTHPWEKDRQPVGAFDPDDPRNQLVGSRVIPADEFGVAVHERLYHQPPGRFVATYAQWHDRYGRFFGAEAQLLSPPAALKWLADRGLTVPDDVKEAIRAEEPTATKAPAKVPATTSTAGRWEGDDWDRLGPKERQLLLYMQDRAEADLHDLCPFVWGKEYLTDGGVSEAARETVTSRANEFLRRRDHGRLLRKVRGEPVIRWE
jgi:hypothetical protein